MEISVIVPCYNSSNTILETLNSINSQTFRNFECIIVNDNSCDDSQVKVEEFIKDKKKFQIINLLENSGVSNARNIGIRKSKGKYLSFLDSDDLWDPNFLEISLNFMKSNNLEFVYAPYRRFFDSNKSKYFVRNVPFKSNYFSMLFNNHIPLLTGIIDKKLVGNTEFINDRFEDYLFWLSIFKKNKNLYALRVSQSPIASYRLSKTQRSSNKIVNIKRAFKIYYHYLKKPFLNSLMRTIFFIFYSTYDYFIQYMNYILRRLS